MQLHAMSLRTIWSIFVSIWVINKCQSGIDIFFLLASVQYNSSFMNISVPSPVFRGKNYDESETLQSVHNVNKGMRFASGIIKSASLILYKGRRLKRINMQAHSRWLHAIGKRIITEKKMWRKKYENTQLFLQVRN